MVGECETQKKEKFLDHNLVIKPIHKLKPKAADSFIKPATPLVDAFNCYYKKWNSKENIF